MKLYLFVCVCVIQRERNRGEKDRTKKFVCPRSFMTEYRKTLEKLSKCDFTITISVKYMKHSFDEEITLGQSEGHLKLLDIDQIVGFFNSAQRLKMIVQRLDLRFRESFLCQQNVTLYICRLELVTLVTC